MATCSRLATSLDLEMLNYEVAPANVPDDLLPKKSGADVYIELGKRHILRFIGVDHHGAFRHGSEEVHFTTPTPYPSDEVIDILHLPAVANPRLWVIVLDPREIPIIAGPRFVRFGSAIEYILPDGFPEDALVGGSRWEVQVS